MNFIKVTEKETNKDLLIPIEKIQFVGRENEKVFIAIKVFQKITFGFKINESYEEVLSKINYFNSIEIN